MPHIFSSDYGMQVYNPIEMYDSLWVFIQSHTYSSSRMNFALVILENVAKNISGIMQMLINGNIQYSTM